MKTMKKITMLSFIFILSALRALFAASEAPWPATDDPVIRETREAGAFTGIQVGGAFKIFITQTGTPSVEVEADEEIMPYIRTEVVDGILRVGLKKCPEVCMNHVKVLHVYLTVADLKSLDLSGAVEISCKNQIAVDNVRVDMSGAVEADLNFAVTGLEMELSGACEIDLKGTGQNLNIQASGASELNAFDFAAKAVNVFASGANETNVHASGTLKVKVSGACDVRYKGTATVDVYSSGASSVRRVE
jgi:hypothetical protein